MIGYYYQYHRILTKVKYTSSEKWILLATILASSLVFIDGTALNIAMPALQLDMGLSGPQLLWVVNAYSLFLSALLLIGGAMGDLYGRNRIFSIGLFLFMVASFFCGMDKQAPIIVGKINWYDMRDVTNGKANSDYP